MYNSNSSSSSSMSKSNESAGKRSLKLMKTSQERRRYANELMDKVKGHIPVVLEAPKELALDLHDPNKVVMVGSSLKILNFLEFLRKKIKLDESMSLFLFANDRYMIKSSK